MKGIRVFSQDGSAIREVTRLSLRHRCGFQVVRHPDVFMVPRVILEELESKGVPYEWVELTDEETKAARILATAAKG
jgi:hypothetical protein